MTDQLALFGPRPRAPYRKESPASRDGAIAVEPVLNEQLRACLDEYRKAASDLTDRELAYLTGFPINVVNARRNELMAQGLVRGPVRRRKSKCPGATPVSVGAWKVTAKGRRE